MDAQSVKGLMRIWSCPKNTRRGRFRFLVSVVLCDHLSLKRNVNSKSVNNLLDVSCSPEEFWIWLWFHQNRHLLKDTYLNYSVACLGATALSHRSYTVIGANCSEGWAILLHISTFAEWWQCECFFRCFWSQWALSVHSFWKKHFKCL